MKNLTNLCNYIYENIDYLVDFICSIDVLYLWNCRGKYKPKVNMWAFYGSISEKDFPLIKNYNIWLTFFCDYIGYDILIYYPKNVKKGDRIKVLFKGLNIDGFIYWHHGNIGLFDDFILPLLYLDKLPLSDTRINILDVVNLYSKYDNTYEINNLLDITKSIQKPY